MIPIRRVDLNDELSKKLDKKSAALRDKLASIPERKERTDRARSDWKSADQLRSSILSILCKMASGVERCMYCADSQGTTIDHFKPIANDPHSTFAWLNHLLACSYCNSNAKRDQWSESLVDPTVDDPHDHLRLNFSTGDYSDLTRRGEETIRVFGLQRAQLVKGRREAFIRCRIMIRCWYDVRAIPDCSSRATEMLSTLKAQPFADVLYAMIRRRSEAGAAIVFGAEVVAALGHVSELISSSECPLAEHLDLRRP